MTHPALSYPYDGPALSDDEYDLLLVLKGTRNAKVMYVGIPFDNPLAFRPDKITFGDIYPITYYGLAVADLPSNYYYVQVLLPNLPDEEAKELMVQLIDEHFSESLAQLELEQTTLWPSIH